MEEPRYKRVLLKISGEALAGERHFGLDFDVIGRVCDAVKEAVDMGVQVGVVVGGGNFWRGVKDGGGRMERTRADHMGMLATVMNALAVADVLESRGVAARVQTAVEMRAVAEPYVRGRAIHHLEKGRVVIFGCGTGNPFFSTDTAAVLRRVQRGPGEGSQRGEVRRHLLRRRALPASGGHGRHRHQPVHGQPHPRAAVCPEGPLQYYPRTEGREDRYNCEGGYHEMKTEYKEFEERMRKSINSVAADFAAVRAGRANASVLDRIMVDYYGTPTPIHQIASIGSPDPRTLTIQPWDAGAVKLICKAIQESDLGINPQNDGKIIRLAFPQLTEERRKELVKQIAKYAEGGKVAIRNIRRDAVETFKARKKNSEITEDDMKIAEKDIQKMTDDMCKEIDELLAKKEQELLAV